MTTKINSVFVSTVGLHPTAGNWRHRADRGCHIICVYIYSHCLWVLTTTLCMHSDVWGDTDTHPWLVLQEARAHAPKSQPHNQKIKMAMFDKYHKIITTTTPPGLYLQGSKQFATFSNSDRYYYFIIIIIILLLLFIILLLKYNT